MPLDLIIRQERVEDIASIHETVRMAFEKEAEATLVDVLRESSDFVNALSIVAVQNSKIGESSESSESSEIVGHTLFSKLRIERQEDKPVEVLGLGPVSVRPDVQRQGIGQAMIWEGLKVARELGFRAVIVLGHPQYYPRFGFVKASQYRLRAPWTVPLIDHGLDQCAGLVVYPAAFDGV